MTTHDLKTWPVPFSAVLNDTKTYEIRRDDRRFWVGDRLRLREWMPSTPTNDGLARYTGREILVEVTYKTPGGDWGLPMDLCVLAIRKVEA